MTLLLSLGILFWVICGAFDYAFSFAYFQRKYTLIAAEQYASQRRHCIGMALGGPIALLASLYAFDGAFSYGLKWR